MTVSTNSALTGILGADYIQDYATPGVFNVTPLNLQKWRKALARASTGGAVATINCIGDSTTWGQWSNGAPERTNVKAKAFPTVLATELQRRSGMAAQAQSWFGVGSSSEVLNVSDPRIAITAGWANAGGSLVSVGGGIMRATVAGKLSFTPSANVDTFDFWYVQGPGSNGSFDYDIDGGAATTINSNNAVSAVVKVSVSAGAADSHTINFSRVSSTVYIIGAEGRLSTDKIAVRNMGWANSASNEWKNSAAAYNPLPTAVTIAPDLYILDLGINDWRNGVSVATYVTNMQTIITALKAVTDVVLCVPIPSSTSEATQATQDNFKAAIYGLAATNNLPLVDKSYRMVDYTTANALGYYGDTLHLLGAGYNDVAMPIAQVLARP
jgi:lysophospholipase L1-like esterase